MKNNKVLVLLIGIMLIISLVFSYQFQKPLMISGEAIVMAVEYLKNPPKQWNAALSSDLVLQEIPMEDISLTLSSMDGFFNKIMNKMQWNVTIMHNGKIQTVSMSAYTGAFLNMYGPLH